MPDGSLLYQVVRYKPKGFSQRRPDGNGGWIWKLEDRRVLYRWAELLKFPDATVFFTEGEKDADRLASLEYCATTVASGSWTEECAKALAGRDVIILEDNDAPGRKRALEAANVLNGIAKTIRIVQLPDLLEGKAVSDWLDADPSRADQFPRVCFDVPIWDPAEEPATEPEAALESVRASDVKLRAIEWLWPNRFAIGKLGLIVGLPDEGKGQVLCDMAARVTTGGQWPCKEGNALLGNVVLLTAEDGIEDTVTPRLKAAGADLDRVIIVKMVRQKGEQKTFSLITDLPLLQQKIVEVGNVRLVQIDPIASYLGVGKMDSFRTTDVRAILKPLTDLAEEMRVAIVGIMHFNKKMDVSNAMLRISDSLAFPAVARHAYAVVDDQENKRKLFVKAKNNLAAQNTKSLAYSFGVQNVGTDEETGMTITAPHIIWHPEPVDVTASEAMQAAGGSKSPSSLDAAKRFLEEQLADGPVAKTDIDDAAEASCISERTLRRAKDDLKITPKKDGPNNTWRWHLPPKKQNRADE
jgi:putative DNA primase/helicase